MPAGTLLDDLPDPDCLLARARQSFQDVYRPAIELWQLDVVHGFLLVDGTHAKSLDGRRRPLEVLRLGQAHGAGTNPGRM